MSSNRKKRLSIIDFFGKSNESSPTSKATKKKHQRSTSGLGSNANEANKDTKARNRLTFTIPDESIVSNIDFRNIPSPQPLQKPNRANVQINTAIHRNTPSPKANKRPTISSPVSPVIKNGKLTLSGENTRLFQTPSPVRVQSQSQSQSQPQSEQTTPSRIYQNNTPSKDRLVSNTSLSSSVYPNENKNVVESSPLDFARKSSSIYPPSTIPFDRSNRTGMSTSGTIKRTDLLRKRKPPPMPLSVMTEAPVPVPAVRQDHNPDQDHEHEHEVVSPDATRVSATESFASSGTGYSPLHLLPVAENVTMTGFKSPPLSSDKQLDPSKNVMFTSSSVDYEPPSFISKEYDTDNLNTIQNSDNNIHKHAKTLSSIEEITNALDSFQLEHEQSFNAENAVHHTSFHSTTESKESAVSGEATNSEQKGDISGETNSVNHDISEKEERDDQEGIFLKVKDLPKINNGESLDEYINKLKELPNVELAHTSPKKANVAAEGEHLLINTPKSLTNSETSSTSEIFFDVRESSKDKMPLESGIDDREPTLQYPTSEGADSVITDNIDHAVESTVNDLRFATHSLNREESAERFTPTCEHDNTPKTLSSVDSGHQNGLKERVPVDQDYSESFVSGDSEGRAPSYGGDADEVDLIGPLDHSFESFVKTIKSHDRSDMYHYDNDIDKDSEVATTSTGVSDEQDLVQMDDGGWQRYSNATNFFNDADMLEDGEIIETNNFPPELDTSNLDKPADVCSGDDDELTPTDDNGGAAQMHEAARASSQRDFDLDDELENNITTPIEPDANSGSRSSTNSLEDLYPADSDGEYLDDDDNKYTEASSSEDGSVSDASSVSYVYKDEDGDGDGVEVGDENENENEDEEGSYAVMLDGTHGNGYAHIHDDVPPAYSETASSRGDGESSVLEFSPRSVYRKVQEDHLKTPELNEPSPSNLSDDATDVSQTGTPTGLGIGGRGFLKVINDEDGSTEFSRVSDREELDGVRGRFESDASIDENEYRVAPIPDLDSIVDDQEETVVPTYDRRETPFVRPIEHSMVVNAAAPIVGTSSYVMKSRRPPPSFPSVGRRSRGLSEATANPEMFMNGLPNKRKPSISEGEGAVASTDPSHVNQTNTTGPEKIGKESSPTPDEPEDTRKGEKCIYIENLRLKGRKAIISTKPPMQTLPIAIRQNGTITHKKIPSQQLSGIRMRNNKHVAARPKTRMLASEIDDGELPDATKLHSGKKTKVPIHPDAAVIAASEQFNRLTKERSSGGDLGRFNSVMSVRPHYGDGMRLFITNPDSDDD